MANNSGEDVGRSHLVVWMKFKDNGRRNDGKEIDLQRTQEWEYLNKIVKGKHPQNV